jgi:multiple sugar transport system substrate-binding protein
MDSRARRIVVVLLGIVLVVAVVFGVRVLVPPHSGISTPVQAQTPAEPQVLHVALFQAPASLALQQLVPQFEKAEHARVDIQIFNYDDLYKKFDQQVLTHSGGFDVVMIDCILIPSYATKGTLAKLDPSVVQSPAYDYGDVLPALADYLGRYPAGGTLYGVPFMSNTHMMAYRPKLVDPIAHKLGLALPGTDEASAWTWSDYMRVAGAITAEGKGKYYGTSLQARPGAWIVYEWYSVLFAFDPNIADRKTGLPDFQTAGVAAAQYYSDLYKVAPKAALTWGHEEETGAMCGGLTAMDATSNVELAANLIAPKCDSGLGPLAFGFPPKNGNGSSSPDMGGYGLFVTSTSNEKALAQKFLEWASSKSVHLQVVLHGGSPVRSSELGNAEVLRTYPYLKFYGGLIATSVYRARIPQWPEMQDVISRHLTDVMTDQDTAQNAMGEVQSWVDHTLPKK